MKMQALSIVSPWGTRIAEGVKHIEVRRWRPPTLPVKHLLIVENHRRLTKPDEVDPEGRAVAVVNVADVSDWTPDMAEAACSQWEPGWLAWILSDIRPIDEPFAIIAARKIYAVEVDQQVVFPH